MKCCVKGCQNQSRFTFPKNEAVRKQWLEAIRRPDFVPKNKHGLCADHFAPEDIPTESFTGGYKTERIVLRKHVVPSVFPWTKAMMRKEKKIVENIGNDVEVKTENSPDYDFDTMYKKCLDSLTGSPFQSIFIKSERFELDGIEQGDVKIYKNIGNNEISGNRIQVSKIIVKPEASGTSSVDHYEANTSSYDDDDNSYFYIESDVRLIEHDYHVAKTHQCRSKIPKPRYSVEQFRDDPKGLKVFTGLGCYERFMEVFRGLGDGVYRLVYSGNGSTGKLSVMNQFFLTIWKLKRNCSDFDLSRHFNVSVVAVGNIFRTWVRFLALERPKIEIRPGKEIFEFYKINRFEKYYAHVLAVASAASANRNNRRRRSK